MPSRSSSLRRRPELSDRRRPAESRIDGVDGVAGDASVDARAIAAAGRVRR
jgi:hypothetical protein